MNLKYLARYTHRVAISNSRLVEIDEDSVQFSWKNYRKNHKIGTTRMKAHEFIRRFLLHVLPKGFTRIRHYGILANRLRSQTIQTCRALLAESVDPPDHDKNRETDSAKRCVFRTKGFRVQSSSSRALLASNPIERREGSCFHAKPRPFHVGNSLCSLNA